MNMEIQNQNTVIFFKFKERFVFVYKNNFLNLKFKRGSGIRFEHFPRVSRRNNRYQKNDFS